MDREMVQGPGQHSSVIRTALIAVFMACTLAGHAAWASGETDAALQAYRDGNYPAAIKIWRKLAANDNPDAQYALGVAYLKGHGVEWKLTEAIAWFERAAQAGHVSAMFNLAGIFWEGRGTQQDFSRAVHWWQQAAAHDDSASQYNLGLAYFLGQGVTSNPAQAIAWLQKANRNGYPGAQSALELVKDALSETPPNEIVSRDAESVVSPSSTSAVPAETGDVAEATIIPTSTSEIVSSTMQRTERVAPTAITPTSSTSNDTPTIATVVTPAGVPWLTASENEAPTSVPADATTATVLTETAKALLTPVTVEETHLRQAAQGTSAQAAIITGEAVQAYATRAGLLPVLGTLMPDTPIKILSVTDEWTQVLIPGGIDVWVFDQFIAEDDQGARIQGEGVRARSVPSTGADSKVIGYFSHGDTVTVQSVQGQWKLVTPSAIPLAVWIMSEHVQLLETVSPLHKTLPIDTTRSDQNTDTDTDTDTVPENTSTTERLATETLVETTVHAKAPSAVDSPLESALNPPTSFRAGIVNVAVGDLFGVSRPGARPLEPVINGTAVKILLERGDWAQVKTAGGLAVWVHNDFVSEHQGVHVIRANGVNAWSSPPPRGGDEEHLLTFQQGDAISIISRQGEWTRLRALNSVAGWMRRDQLDILDTVTAEWTEKWSRARASIRQ
jgi:SH3-like domain-containing protein